MILRASAGIWTAPPSHSATRRAGTPLDRLHWLPGEATERSGDRESIQNRLRRHSRTDGRPAGTAKAADRFSSARQITSHAFEMRGCSYENVITLHCVNDPIRKLFHQTSAKPATDLAPLKRFVRQTGNSVFNRGTPVKDLPCIPRNMPLTQAIPRAQRDRKSAPSQITPDF